MRLVNLYLDDGLFYSLFINLTPLGSALKGFSLEGNLTGLIPLDIYFDNPPPLSPSLHKGGGIGYVREASPLLNSPFSISFLEGEVWVLKGLRLSLSLLLVSLPLIWIYIPIMRGKYRF